MTRIRPIIPRLAAVMRVADMAARGTHEGAVYRPPRVSPMAGALQRGDPMSLGAGRPPIMGEHHGATDH